MAKRLTLKQERFIDEYIIDGNATQAAIRAGYSEKTAYTIGRENLNKPQIAKILKERRKQAVERINITQDDILKGLREIAVDKKAPKAPRVAAWTALAKMAGIMVEKRKIEHTGKVKHEHNLSDSAKGKLKEVYEAGK